MSMELLFIDTGFQDRKSDLQDSKSNWTSLFRIVPASDVSETSRRADTIDIIGFSWSILGFSCRKDIYGARSMIETIIARRDIFI